MSLVRVPYLLVGGLAMRFEELRPLGEDLKAKYKSEYLGYDNINVGNGPRWKKTNCEPLAIFDQAEHQWKRLDSSGLSPDQKINLFGMSMGGMIVATMAKIRPERVNKLILAVTSANFKELPAIPDKSYKNFSSFLSEAEIFAAISLAFGQTCLKERPELRDTYFDYRIKGKNLQSGREFVSQVDSIRSFPGEAVYKGISALGFPIEIIAGSEDQLFNHHQLELLTKILPQAKLTILKKTGHMLHIENPSLLLNAL